MIYSLRSSCRFSCATLLLLFTSLAFARAGTETPSADNLRFIDAATGFSISPEEVTMTPGDDPQNLAVEAENYRSFSATVVPSSEERRLQFVLEPLSEPAPLRPENIEPLRQADATLFLGYVADDDIGQPIAGVQVKSYPSGVTTQTDSTGFFSLSIPLQTNEEAASSPASLVFEKTGYDLEEFHQIELFPYGDWTYRVRLKIGNSVRITEENEIRRRESPRISPEDAALMPPPTSARSLGEMEPFFSPTASSAAIVRTPTYIRVLLEDDITIEYVPMETYVERSLPQEWVASWGAHPGGENSLRAGAVAIRTYAIGFVNNPRASDYDICATTTCQVYRPTTHSRTTAAARLTSHYVMVNSNGAITFKLTEYSAENNSLGFPCGDGFTAPSGGCIFDPACTGEERYGHGRGLCQWGSARWATGYKFEGRDYGDKRSNGYPKKDWIEILNHYFPNLTLTQGAPLSIGDFVRVSGNSSRPVRMCSNGGIANGANCPLITYKSPDSTGTIIGGPTLIASDGLGHIWWKIQWNDSSQTVGWSAENWLERDIAPPPAPQNLTATAPAATQIDLTWSFPSGTADGFRIERALDSNGPWTQIETTSAAARSYSDTDLSPLATRYYRILAYNAGGPSSPSNTASATTPDLPPILPPIPDKQVDEGTPLTFTVTATAPEQVVLLTDFENFSPGNGVIFQLPSYSGSTTDLLETTPNTASVASTFPSGNDSSLALHVAWSWKTGTNRWLRLTTANTPTLGNPVIDFTKKFRFRIHTDPDLDVALGLRETNTPAGTPIGSRDNSSGGIEFVGVSGKSGAAPIPTRTITAGSWQTVEFDLPNEPVINFVSGNGTLTSTTGLGVLEHLALVPASGTGSYEVYLDDFAVVESRSVTFSLAPGVPAGASINATTGLFTWTPSEAQGPGVYPITVRATTDGSSGATASRTFQVTVREINQPPVLAPVAEHTIHPGHTLTFAASASDPDLPENSLTFQLGSGAPTTTAIDPDSGAFSWTTTLENAGQTYPITLRVIDDGVPPLEDSVLFQITVTEPLTIQTLSQTGSNELNLTWNAIAGATYRLQTTTNLSDPTWTDVPPEIVAADSQVTLSIPVESNSSKQFYRIQFIR